MAWWVRSYTRVQLVCKACWYQSCSWLVDLLILHSNSGSLIVVSLHVRELYIYTLWTWAWLCDLLWPMKCRRKYVCHFWARQRASVWFTSVCFLFPLVGNVPDSGCSSGDPGVKMTQYSHGTKWSQWRTHWFTWAYRYVRNNTLLL